MQWIVLIGNESLSLNSIKNLKHNGSIREYDVPEFGDRYCIEFDTDHIFYDYEEGENATIDYSPLELEQIPFSTIHTLTMVYQSEARMKKIIKQENFLKDVYIDNGYGLILPINKFIQLGMPMNK